MFVVIRIRKGAEVIKDWYGVKAVESLTLADLFDEFKNGTLDCKSPLTLDNPIVTAFVGQKKSDVVTQISPDVSLGEAVPCLGNFIDFTLTDSKNDSNGDGTSKSEGTKSDYFTILMAAANKAKHLPERKVPFNQKTKLFNDILSWLQQLQVGFMSTNVTTLGTQ